MVRVKPEGMAAAGVSRRRLAGVAGSLPFADKSVDAAMAVSTDQHWPDAIAGYREMQRVARRVVSFHYDIGVLERAFWLIRDYLPEHARLMGKMSIIRSVHHDNGDHYAAAHWMLTGYLGSNALNMNPMYPSAGSLIARLQGPKRPGMPAYVGLPNTHSVGIKPGYHGSAYLGRSYNPFMADGDPNSAGYRVSELTLPKGLDAARLDDDAVDARQELDLLAAPAYAASQRHLAFRALGEEMGEARIGAHT